MYLRPLKYSPSPKIDTFCVCSKLEKCVNLWRVNLWRTNFWLYFPVFFGPEIDIFWILRPFSKKECFWRNKVIKTFTGFFNLLEPSQNHMDIMWQWHLSMSFRREIPFSPPKMTIRFSPLFGLRFKKINFSGDFGILMKKDSSGDFSIFNYWFAKIPFSPPNRW